VPEATRGGQRQGEGEGERVRTNAEAPPNGRLGLHWPGSALILFAAVTLHFQTLDSMEGLGGVD
jgi:hypothetical protein